MQSSLATAPVVQPRPDALRIARELPPHERAAQLTQWEGALQRAHDTVYSSKPGADRAVAFSDLKKLDQIFAVLVSDKNLFQSGSQEDRRALLALRNAHARNLSLLGKPQDAEQIALQTKALALTLTDPKDRTFAMFQANSVQFLSQSKQPVDSPQALAALQNTRKEAERLISHLDPALQRSAKGSVTGMLVTEIEILTRQHRTREARELAQYVEKSYAPSSTALSKLLGAYLIEHPSIASKFSAALRNTGNVLARPEGQDYVKALKENAPVTLSAGLIAGAAAGGLLGSLLGPAGTVGGAAVGAEVVTGSLTIGALTGMLIGVFGGASAQSLARRSGEITDGAKTGISPHTGVAENALNFLGTLDIFLPAGAVATAGRGLIGRVMSREVLDEGLSALVIRGVLKPTTESLTTPAEQQALRALFVLEARELTSFISSPAKIKELRKIFGQGTDEFLSLLTSTAKIPVRQLGRDELTTLAELAISRATARSLMKLGIGDVALRLGLQTGSVVEQLASTNQQFAPPDVIAEQKQQLLRSFAVGASLTALPAAIGLRVQKQIQRPLRSIPLHHSEELAEEAFKGRWERLGLPKEAAAKHYVGGPLDPATGLALPVYRTSSLERAINHVNVTGVPSVSVSGEMRNLGGVNLALGHAKANDVMSDIASVFRELPRGHTEQVIGDVFSGELSQLGGTLMAFRLNGPRFHAIISGVSPVEVRIATDRAVKRVNQQLDLDGLSRIPHPKGGGNPPGVSLNIGVAEIKRTDDIGTAFGRSDGALKRNQQKEYWTLRARGITPSLPTAVEPPREFTGRAPVLSADIATMDPLLVIDPWERALTSFTERVKQGTGRRLSRFEAGYLRGGTDNGGAPSEMIDPVTQLYTPNHHIETLLALQELHQATGKPAVTGGIDISNLGGYSKADGNRILMRSSQLIRKYFPAKGLTDDFSANPRVGGDELGVNTFGLPENVVRERFQQMEGEFNAWAASQTVMHKGKRVPMMSVPHTKKGREAGVRIDWGVASIRADESILTPLQSIDKEIDTKRAVRIRQ